MANYTCSTFYSYCTYILFLCLFIYNDCAIEFIDMLQTVVLTLVALFSLDFLTVCIVAALMYLFWCGLSQNNCVNCHNIQTVSIAVFNLFLWLVLSFIKGITLTEYFTWINSNDFSVYSNASCTLTCTLYFVTINHLMLLAFMLLENSCSKLDVHALILPIFCATIVGIPHCKILQFLKVVMHIDNVFLGINTDNRTSNHLSETQCPSGAIILISVIHSPELHILYFPIILIQLIGLSLNASYMLLKIFLIIIAGDVHTNPGPNADFCDIRMCLTNIRGLVKNHDFLKASLCDDHDIICVNETFLDPTYPDSKLMIQGYQSIIRKDRQNFGGGVAIYVKQCVAAKRRRDLEVENIEMIALEIRSHNNKFLLFNVYNPNNRDIDFYDELQGCVDLARPTNIDRFLIVGDLNSDFQTVKGRELQQFCANNSLNIHISEPTRYTQTTRTCLDQVLSNCSNAIKSTNILPPVGSSDHCTVSIDLLFRVKKQPSYYRLIWQYSQADFDGLKNSLQTTNWDEHLNTEDINELASNFTTTLLNLAREFIPNKVITVRPNDKPWYNSNLRALRRRKDRLHTKATERDTAESWANYRHARNIYFDSCRIAKEEYRGKIDNSLEEGPVDDPKKWYKISKSLLERNNVSSYPPLSVNNELVVDIVEKASALNNFFLSICQLDDSEAIMPPNVDATVPTLKRIQVTQQEVYDILRCIDTTKATGPDGVSSRLLKETAASIHIPLTKIFNKSLHEKEFPKCWKEANVIPIYKKGDAQLCTNYRPVSLLSCTSKVFERVIFKHLYNFIITNKIISPSQSGFTPGDGTTYQLIDLYHIFSKAIDEGKEVRVVFCDISKAFDKVWHPGLLYKLSNCGIQGELLEWLSSYLTDRKQRVTLEGQASDWGVIKAGVPQGSVLGPLLFLLYINDITNVINNPARLFADDTSLYIIIDDNNVIQSGNSLNNDLEHISQWASNWLVQFNATKTLNMTISRKLQKQNHPTLIFNDTDILQVNSHKHLGLTMNSTLTWSEHILEICSKACKTLNIMHALKYRLSRKALESIYTSFLRPTLEYCDVIWDNCLQKEKDLLENIQLAAARIVTGARRGTSHALLYEETGWNTLQERRDIHKLVMMYKIINDLAPQYLKNALPPTAGERAGRNLRNNSNLEHIKCHSTHFLNSFFPSAIKHWNQLSVDIRQSTTLSTFKSKVSKIFSRVKPLPYYYKGNRKTGIILACMRMGCSNLNSDLFKIKVVASEQCPCGAGREDVYHYFFICTRYTIARNVLYNSITSVAQFHLKTLLYGTENQTHNDIIIMSIEKFISDTKRFD